ncbi:hypothetical protein [Mycolicibacterium sp. P1-5]|uniref:hypothetical protein n=1 Tax=Mycolicibacterium sp. P1-5 TaxID=2024617 RepID=UPI0011ECE1B7|nr:hypothetical protein [Mycolicibacterium sp. P1-5]KAA0105155.1 hypothetical protein CIW47_20435 [Mycolicibacterium sp. P1-5]
MTAPRPELQRPASVFRGYFDQINEIAQDAGRRDDAGRWGTDGWVRLFHNLLDLNMRTYAGAVQVALAGPQWWLQPVSTQPIPPDPIDVAARSYPRSVSIFKAFERIGRPDVRIPLQALHFEPTILGARETAIQIALTDARFTGANYTGQLRLRRADGAGQDSETVTVTVGL